MTGVTRDKLMVLIRNGLDLEEADTALSQAEAEELLRLASRQSILQIVARGLKKTSASAGIRAAFDKACNNALYGFLQRDAALKKICAVLDETGIPYVPLKGAVLRDLYPEPFLRSSSDIDILVHEENLDKAVRVIEENTDFRNKGKHYHDVSMVSSRVHLELHFSIKENLENIDRLLVRVWDYTVPSGEGSRYVLNPEFKIFHVLAHMSNHMIRGGLGIRPFLDLWLLRNKTQFDEAEVRNMCEKCGILIFYEKCCRLADAWLSGNPVPEDLAVLEEYCLSGGVFGNKETAIAADQRGHRGFSHILRRVFMDRSLLETEFPELKENPWRLPLYQTKRWLRLLDPQKRLRAQEELKRIRETKAEAIDSFDKLLSSLGL